MNRTIAVLTLSLVTACADNPPPAPQPPPRADAPPAATTPPAPPSRLTADATPTVLTDEQKAKDAALAPRAAALVDAFYDWDARFSPDGKKVLFRSGRDGVPAVYVADAAKADAPVTRITTGAERVDWASFTRDGKAILFARDEGADENYRLYRIGLDGKGEKVLTPGAKLHRDPPALPRNKPDLMVYSSHDPKLPASDVVVQSASGGDPKTVFTDPAPAFVIDVTADGARALLVRWVSASELIVFEVDLAKGTSRRVFPAEGKRVTVNDARYSADGKRIFVAADDGTEGQYLYALDAATGAVKGSYLQNEPSTAFVQTVEVSPRGDRLAILVNAGNHSEMRIVDAQTLKVVAKAKTPLGWVDVLPFSADGKRVSLNVSAPDAPAEVYAVDAATGAATPVRTDPRPGLDKLEPLATTIETTKAFDGKDIPLNVYLPKDTAGKKLPVIVNFHGGPSWSYQVRWNPGARFFLSLGWGYVEPNMRGSTGFGRAYEQADDREKRADALKDMETVNTWAKGQTWADRSRVVVMGGSYGGYVVLMAVTRQPTLWRAGVDLFGIADLRTFLKTTDQAIRAGFVQEFGDLDKDGALLDEFSPLRDKDKVVAPLFVYAGQNDPRVPRSESDAIVMALRTRQIPNEYMVAANEGHSLDRRDTKIEYMTRVARFLDANTK